MLLKNIKQNQYENTSLPVIFLAALKLIISKRNLNQIEIWELFMKTNLNHGYEVVPIQTAVPKQPAKHLNRFSRTISNDDIPNMWHVQTRHVRYLKFVIIINF